MCECNLINDISVNTSNDNATSNHKSATIKPRSFLGRSFPASTPANKKGGHAYEPKDHPSTKTRDRDLSSQND